MTSGAVMHHQPTLEIDIAAIVRNYLLLKGKLISGECGAVVKANAYGLGVEQVAPALYSTGCRDFFVATLAEAVQLRGIFEQDNEMSVLLTDARIFAFHGVRKSEVDDFTHHRIIPVLNSLEQIGYWENAGPYALHVDTGMRRLGLSPAEIDNVHFAAGSLQLVLSHLACANETAHSMNRQQLRDFKSALAHFPGTPVSFANSSGIFLGAEYHFDLARPGCSLYGISPDTSLPNPMENVVTLSAPILQYRKVTKPESVGYGATVIAPAGSVLATVEMGYADGFLRSLSNRFQGFAESVPVPLMGRVSMDMLIFDVSRVPEHLRTPDLRVTLIGEELPVDSMADAAGTIGYEILSRIGSRVKRLYKE